MHDRIDTIQTHRVAAPGEAIALGIVVNQVQDTALAEHDVVIQILAQAFPEFHRVFIELRVWIEHIVRAYDSRVAPGVAAADITFFQYRNPGNPVQFRQVVRGRKTVTAATDYDDVILFFGLRITPGPGPAAIAG